jgi:hypothetical protein
MQKTLLKLLLYILPSHAVNKETLMLESAPDKAPLTESKPVVQFPREAKRKGLMYTRPVS